ncbi:Hypothetical predicted protein [Podarcis lilfordi]|uniref:Uncharacterized protein n=1 Tax=Podarcis lilfordi TaxID=74358 RepID=A0AA35P348_9SAUR|nr:Hypothetical predicted protein [Podarcis lilfordi]
MRRSFEHAQYRRRRRPLAALTVHRLRREQKKQQRLTRRPSFPRRFSDTLLPFSSLEDTGSPRCGGSEEGGS